MAERRAILILGQKKAGTTSLYSVIEATGLPFIDIPKESGVMNSRALLQKTLAEKPDAILLDATTTYFEKGRFSDDFIANLGAFGQVSVLYICRPESERMASHYRHSLNHDGWSGDATTFAGSGEYLNHARLSVPIAALQELGVSDITIVPFSLLGDPDRLQPVIGRIVGREPDMDKVSAQNRFGSLLVMPRPVQKFIGSSFFQLRLRKLIPNGLRERIKAALGSSAQQVDTSGLADPACTAAAEGVDAENAQLLDRFGPDSQTR